MSRSGLTGLHRIPAAAAVIGAVSLPASVAYADHTSYSTEWWFGIGDGADNDNHVHPFMNSEVGHKHCGEVRTYMDSAVLKGDVDVCGTHIHDDFSWSSDVRECRFFASFRTEDVGPGYHRLAPTFRFHHSDCRGL